MLTKKRLFEYIEDVQSDQPTPGGGSVSALVGTLASALSTMVIRLSIDKKAYLELDETDKEKLQEHALLLSNYQLRLSEIITEDTQAFDEVMVAFKLPKDSDKEKQTRSEAILNGYKKALEVPLECAKLCLKVLESQNIWVQHGNKNCVSDIGVGALLAYSGLEGALLNVLINLSSIKDSTYQKDIHFQVDDLLAQGKLIHQKIMEQVYLRLNY